MTVQKVVRHIFRLPCFGAALIGIGCADVDGQGEYATRTIGYVNRTVSAVVLAAEPVSIRSAGAGGRAYGGLGGGAIASSSDDASVVIAGVIAGAVVGALVEEAANTHPATKYVLKTENGATLVVAQVNKGTDTFRVGDRVRVLYGSPNRLVKDAQ